MKLPYAVRPAAPLKQAKAWSDEQVPDRMHALLRHEQRVLVKIFPVCLIFWYFFLKKVRELPFQCVYILNHLAAH